MLSTDRELVTIHIAARQNVTLLPRVVQILSRRGAILMQLTTSQEGARDVTMICVVDIPSKWGHSIAALLQRLIDVRSVDVVENISHE